MKCYCYGECLGIPVLLNGVCLAFGESEKKKLSFFEHKKLKKQTNTGSWNSFFKKLNTKWYSMSVDCHLISDRSFLRPSKEKSYQYESLQNICEIQNKLVQLTVRHYVIKGDLDKKVCVISKMVYVWNNLPCGHIINP